MYVRARACVCVYIYMYIYTHVSEARGYAAPSRMRLHEIITYFAVVFSLSGGHRCGTIVLIHLLAVLVGIAPFVVVPRRIAVPVFSSCSSFRFVIYP